MRDLESQTKEFRIKYRDLVSTGLDELILIVSKKIHGVGLLGEFQAFSPENGLLTLSSGFLIGYPDGLRDITFPMISRMSNHRRDRKMGLSRTTAPSLRGVGWYIHEETEHIIVGKKSIPDYFGHIGLPKYARMIDHLWIRGPPRD